MTATHPALSTNLAGHVHLRLTFAAFTVKFSVPSKVDRDLLKACPADCTKAAALRVSDDGAG